MAWPRRTKSRMAVSRPRRTLPANSWISAPASQDYRAHGCVRLDLIQCRHQAVDQIIVQRIQLVGPVERDQRNAAVDFEQDGIGHQGLRE
jgi:hypothetical protein